MTEPKIITKRTKSGNGYNAFYEGFQNTPMRATALTPDLAERALRKHYPMDGSTAPPKTNGHAGWKIGELPMLKAKKRPPSTVITISSRRAHIKRVTFGALTALAAMVPLAIVTKHWIW